MAEYARSKAGVDPGKLHNELVAAGLPVDYLTAGAIGTPDFVVHTSIDLSAGQITTMDNVIAAHVAGDIPLSGLSQQQWNFDASTTIADPGAGKLRFNSAAFNAVTVLAISTTGTDGSSLYSLLRALRTSDTVILMDLDSPTKWARYTLAAVPTDNTTWFSIPVNIWISSGGMFSTGSRLQILFAPSSLYSDFAPGCTVLGRPDATVFGSGGRINIAADAARKILMRVSTALAFDFLPGEILGGNYVDTQQSTPSTTAVDLATIQEVSFTLTATTDVYILAMVSYINTGSASGVGVLELHRLAPSALNTLHAQTRVIDTANAVTLAGISKVNLAAGNYTYRLRYRVSAGTGFFSQRGIVFFRG